MSPGTQPPIATWPGWLDRTKTIAAISFPISFRLGFFNEPRQPVEFRPGKFRGAHIQQRSHSLFGGSLKECFEHVTQRGSLGALARQRWNVDIPQRFFFVPDVT